MRKTFISISFLLISGLAQAITYVAPTTYQFTIGPTSRSTTGTYLDMRYYNNFVFQLSIDGPAGCTLYVDFSNTNTGSTAPNSIAVPGFNVMGPYHEAVLFSTTPTGLARWVKFRLEGVFTETITGSGIARSTP